MATWFFEDIRTALDGRPRGPLVEPEAIDGAAPTRPWIRLPPGWALFMGVGGLVLVLATIQAGVGAWRSDGAEAFVGPVRDAASRALGRSDHRPGQLRRAVRNMDQRRPS